MTHLDPLPPTEASMPAVHVVELTANPHAKVRLFCFPFAGAGIQTFRAWAQALDPSIQVLALLLPGRENKIREPAFLRWQDLLAATFRAMQPHLNGKPFVFFGHSFVVYQELVHVPLIIRAPNMPIKRVTTPLSTRRIFHTILDTVGRLPENLPNFNPIEAHRLTLQHTVTGHDPENGTAFSEIYPPLNFVKALETRQPELLADFRCLALRRAVVQQDAHTTHKLIHIDENPTEL